MSTSAVSTAAVPGKQPWKKMLISVVLTGVAAAVAGKQPRKKNMFVSVVLTGVASLIAYSSYFVGGWAAALIAPVVVVPSLKGRVYVITGSNRGIGFQLVKRLAQAGATVILCSRSMERGKSALEQLGSFAGEIKLMSLDLASLVSVRAFASEFKGKFERLDGLILNGGVAKTMQDADGFRTTVDGFEEMIATNFLSHFCLTLHLLPVLRATPGARVVAMTSVASGNTYRNGIDYSSWTSRVPHYTDWAQYGQSKLALALFAEQLHSREPSILSVACHPGVARTGITTHSGSWLDYFYSEWFVYGILGMRTCDAVLNPLFCTTAEGLSPGAVYHPVGRRGFKRHWYQRLGALQLPVTINVQHPELWDEAEKAIAHAQH